MIVMDCRHFANYLCCQQTIVGTFNQRWKAASNWFCKNPSVRFWFCRSTKTLDSPRQVGHITPDKQQDEVMLMCSSIKQNNIWKKKWKCELSEGVLWCGTRAKIETIAQPVVATYLEQEAVSIPNPAIELINDKSALLTELLAPVTERSSVANKKETTHLC